MAAGPYRVTALLYAIGATWASLHLKTFRVLFATYGDRQNSPLCGGAQSQAERLHWFSVWCVVLFFVDGAFPAHSATQLTLDDSFKNPIKSYVISKRFAVEFKTNTT
jgi:hypothetical protein